MQRRLVRSALLVLATVVAVAQTPVAAQHQHQHQHGEPAKTGPAPAASSRRITMEELHRAGGVPRGWKFTLPAGGDVARGRQLFADLECYKCHRIEGAGFPPGGGTGNVGPDLTGMGAHHPAEYFAESIVSPNAVLLDGPGWIGPDGTSAMPSYADSLSVTQLLDLVAFIKSQGGGDHAHHQHGRHEQTVGPYRVRLAFHPARGTESAHGSHGAKRSHDGHASHGAKGGQEGHGAHGSHAAKEGHGAHGAHAGQAKPAAAAGAAAGHLMVFVTDATTGEPVPYLPVSAALHVKGASARLVTLTPMVNREGFHYGAEAGLPSGTARIVLTIGPTTMKLVGGDRPGYATPQTVAFEWSAPAK